MRLSALTLLDHLPEYTQLPDFKFAVHGFVGHFPLAHHSPAAEFLLLVLNRFSGELARFAPDLDLGHAGRSSATFFFTLVRRLGLL